MTNSWNFTSLDEHPEGLTILEDKERCAEHLTDAQRCLNPVGHSGNHLAVSPNPQSAYSRPEHKPE